MGLEVIAAVLALFLAGGFALQYCVLGEMTELDLYFLVNRLRFGFRDHVVAHRTKGSASESSLTTIVKTVEGRYGGRVMKSPDTLTDLFRANGWKITAQRQCIFRALEGDETHPSAERVYERVRRQMPNVSLKTVYQTLHDLAELGEISALDLGTGSARFDPNVESNHHHVVCRSCGKVRDIDADFPELRVPPGTAPGFDVLSAEVVFRGLCDECK